MMHRCVRAPAIATRLMMASTTTSSITSRQITTPAEAGRRAQELASAKNSSSNNNNNNNATSSSSFLQHLNPNHLSLDSVLAHAGVAHEDYDGGGLGSRNRNRNLPLAPPLEFATTYTRPAEGPYQEGDSIYTRLDNPTRTLLEQTVFQLDCSFSPSSSLRSSDKEATNDNTTMNEDFKTTFNTCAFASGMMAASSIIMAHKMPITVLLPKDLYHGVSTVMSDVFQERFGVQVRHVDMVNENVFAEELEQVVTTRQQLLDDASKGGGSIIVWMESPSNPRCHVIDMTSICDKVNQARCVLPSVSFTTVVDSTLAPPVIQQPLQFGVDVVMHSGTKYFGGHSDVLLGITTASPYTQQGRFIAPLLRQVQNCVGGVASPMDAWLTLRGLRTLHVRVQRQCETAMLLANHFANDMDNSKESSLVKAVYYPGLPTHPNHHVAKRQMKNDAYGGVLSVELKSEHTAMAFAGALRTIYRATSLGGTETLIEHRASIEPPERVTSPPGLLRLTVGLEDASDLIRDIDNAMAIARQVEQELAP